MGARSNPGKGGAVEPLDVEKMIGELEIAVDRLRSLYEQYFLGFEKLEPMVPRKDVERRVHTLRKEQIRNTALRYRFNMLVQRYNTYQTHWQRICREIENGTYKRHLVRAKARFGDGAPRRSSTAPPGPPISPMTDALAMELADLDREFAPAHKIADTGFQLDSQPPTLTRVPAAASLRPPAPRGDSVRPPVWRRAPPAVPRKQNATAPTDPSVPDPMDDSELERLERSGIGRSRSAIPPAPASATRPKAPVASPPRSPLAQRAASPVATPLSPNPRIPQGQQPAASADDGLSEARVRQIYAQYVDAKRRHKESTAAITYEGVAKSLRESSAKLRQKHGKVVDFEVSEKDGKTILRPVLK
jgi:hypothetical protein